MRGLEASRVLQEARPVLVGETAVGLLVGASPEQEGPAREERVPQAGLAALAHGKAAVLHQAVRVLHVAQEKDLRRVATAH